MTPGNISPEKRSGPPDGDILRTLLTEGDAPMAFPAPPTMLDQWVKSAQSALLAPTASPAQPMDPLQLVGLSAAAQTNLTNPLGSPLGATSSAPPPSPNYQPTVQEFLTQSTNGSNLPPLAFPMINPFYIVAASRQRILFLEQERDSLQVDLGKSRTEIEELKTSKSQDLRQISESANHISRLEFENKMMGLRLLSKEHELEAGKTVLRQLQEGMKALKLRYEGLQQGIDNREMYWNVKMGQAASAYQHLVNEVIDQVKRGNLLTEQLNDLTVKHNNSNPPFKLPFVPLVMKDVSGYTDILNRMNTDGVFLFETGNGLKRQRNDGNGKGPTRRQKKSKRAVSEPPKVP
ncbi:hypothetical protein CAEBREN_03455 [Caenorhabditis brenneri]|uniref:Uncharacterized protein n=1 Tax=Caenorhabditis brenneri TaxID=135651 RepID=G0PJ70_CAEBE|nr:hypothetical protein CAEBREN_03455 [Caenorhabditis brenneri]